MSDPRTLDGPVGLVGAGYIGHLFAQQFALAGCEVRAWSPGSSLGTLHDRLRQSVSALADLGAVERSAIDQVQARVSTHDDLATAVAPCACGPAARERGWSDSSREPYLLETVRPGVFVAGDVRSESTKRVAGAVGDGALAVRFAHQVLQG